jgi:hypothetical protein
VAPTLGNGGPDAGEAAGGGPPMVGGSALSGVGHLPPSGAG